MRRINDKRCVSPVIATVILIGIVLAIAAIAFVWIKGMRDDVITKFGGTNIQLVCNDVSFNAEYSSSTGELSIANNGNVPIFRISVRIEEDGNYETISLSDFDGLNQGATYVGDLSQAMTADKIILIPILLGTSENGNEAYTCDEEFGKEIIVA